MARAALLTAIAIAALLTIVGALAEHFSHLIDSLQSIFSQ
jgi:hypothetical protein